MDRKKVVDDIDWKRPVETGMLVKSPRTNFGVVFVHEESKAVITFKVKVNEGVQPGTKIINTATVSAREVPEKPSNPIGNVVMGKN
ncbi:hypothetical protein ACE38F_27085 [Bacillus mycoides]|uniref:hypothetical protein n=1 Tax=Bacillus mycoides TaxID=1405 RepID=UPI0035CA7C6E